MNTILLKGGMIIILMILNMMSNKELDKQGHRGRRGTHPENSMEGMKFTLENEFTLENDVNTLEMDVVITSDKRVILSHEPWFNSEICLDNSGNNIPHEKEKDFNIYDLSYEEIKKFDCGSLNHPRFPINV